MDDKIIKHFALTAFLLTLFSQQANALTVTNNVVSTNERYPAILYCYVNEKLPAYVMNPSKSKYIAVRPGDTLYCQISTTICRGIYSLERYQYKVKNSRAYLKICGMFEFQSCHKQQMQWRKPKQCYQLPKTFDDIHDIETE